MAKPNSVDEYIAAFDGITKTRLDQLRQFLKQQLPNSEERISYGIPAFFIDGKLVVYYAGYAKHLGLYPGRTNSVAYNKLAEKYAYGKSTARFSHSEPLPTTVIAQFVRTRLKEIGLKA